MKIGIFSEAFDTLNEPFDVQYERTGRNSGNLVFLRSLKKLFNPTFIKPYYGYHDIKEKYEDIDAFITTDLIWIRPNVRQDNVECIFKHIGDRPLIPISVGLQADETNINFEMHPETAKLLQAISERCTIGVRGYYAAYILNKYKIKNIAVIGCPSVFYKPHYAFKTVEKCDMINAVSSFKTAFYQDFHKWCKPSEINYLMYCSAHNMGFVEQTGMNDIALDAPFGLWINTRRKMFFNMDEWDSYLKDFDFHLGMRFHGGVISLQNGLPSLFLTSDSRTTELTDFFCFPKLPISEFDITKPLSYYYERADYSEFQKRFPYLLNNFKAFAENNGLEVNLS